MRGRSSGLAVSFSTMEARVTAWSGDWYGHDPTADAPVSYQHVVVGRGRDYGDVAPLKGVYQGLPARELLVSVHVTRLN